MRTHIHPISLQADENGHLALGKEDLTDLAKHYGTPLYILDEATLRHNCQRFQNPLKKLYPNHLIAFAGKSCLTIGLLNLLAKEGLGVDVVSGGELYSALKSQMKKENIVFHGNNKSKEELSLAIQNEIRIVIDNHQELRNIKETARQLGKKAHVLIRIKPEIEAHTHDYIKTGQIDSKFGIDKRELLSTIKEILASSECEFLGLHSHIGSQIFDIAPYTDLVSLMSEKMVLLKKELGLEIRELNLGGGMGIQYIESDDPYEIESFLETTAKKLISECQKANLLLPKLILEPGRSIVGQAGITLYTIGAIKTIPGIKDYLFVDGGMADNPRPIMYKAKYSFAIANKAGFTPSHLYSIAGKYCESGDILAENILLPKADVEDILVVFSTGAYNYSMASNYNRCCRPAMIMVGKDSVQTIVRRETYHDLIRCDV